MYYATRNTVDRHNRRKCDNLKLEMKLGTHIWEKLVNLSIFGVSVVYTYNVSAQYLAYEETYHMIFCDLAGDIIYNDLNSRPTRLSSKEIGRRALPVPIRIRVSAHIFQTHKKDV